MGGGGEAKLTTPVSGAVGPIHGPQINLTTSMTSPSILPNPFRTSSARFSTLVENFTNKMDSVEDRECKRESGVLYDHVFGPVPSLAEVEKAMSELQRLQGILNPYDQKMLQSPGYGRIRNAFNTLQTEPSVQRMVLSISSDKAVWDAIMNNKAIQDIRGSLHTAIDDIPRISDEESDFSSFIFKWIFDITKSKIMELIEKFGVLVIEILKPAEKEKLKPISELNDLLEEKVRSSVLLSVMILLIVVVTRSHGT